MYTKHLSEITEYRTGGMRCVVVVNSSAVNMPKNIEVQKKGNENNSNLLRRFSRKVRYSGVLNKARGMQYRNRPLSRNMQKKQALEKKRRQKEVDKLIKLGKLPDRRRRGAVINLEESSEE